MQPPPQRGSLVVIDGTMFGGKTEELIARLRQAETTGKRTTAIKHRIDDRYDPDHLVTHTRDRLPALRAPDAESIPDLARNADVVAIDEGHFFGPSLTAVVEQLRKRGVDVIVAGISNDVWGRPLAPMPELAAAADEVSTHRAPCRVCGAPATFNQRLVPVTTPFMVGGADEYEPRCEKHFTPLADPPPP